jgi:ComF family protein
VPLHPHRKAERGYNQAFLVAQNLTDFWRLDVLLPEEALTRLRDTVSQVGLDYADRQTNVGGAFCADPNWVRQRRVVLVDDVCTTGATLDACAIALRSAGATAVRAVTLARAV